MLNVAVVVLWYISEKIKIMMNQTRFCTFSGKQLKSFLSIIFLIHIHIFCFAQTFEAGVHIPAVAYNPPDRFNYLGKDVSHYGLGWYGEENGVPPYAYLSGFQGIKLFTQGIPRFHLDGAGNLGLGTMNANARLHVNGTGIFEDNVKILAKYAAWGEGLLIVKPNGWAGLRLAKNDPSSGDYNGNWALGYTDYSGNDFTISNQYNNVQYNDIFHIRADNRFVGIGTGSPTSKLEIAGGDLSVSGNLIVSTGNTTGGGIKLADDGDIVDLNDGWATHRFSNGIRITNANGGGDPVIQLANNSIIPSYFNVGRVGIGTVNPLGLLHLNGAFATTDGGNNYQFAGTGLIVQANTGGRIADRGAQIEFVVPASVDGSNPWGQGRIITVAGNSNNGDATGKMILGTRRAFSKNGKPVEWFYGDDIVIVGNGNVGINTLNPTEKLAVNGKIRAREIRVDALDMPDYVFEEGYEVGTLEDLESYIKKNKHLPEIPSAIEAEKNGLELGEMNKLLLKKIEELTLYIIEEHKLNEKRGDLLDAQRLKIAELEKTLKSFKK